MNDQYPSHFSIEIDRSRLRNYLRVKWLLMWILPITFFGVFFGFTFAAETSRQGMVSFSDVLTIIALGASIGLAVGLSAGGILYLLFSHRLAARFADSLEVSVEGPFLRVRQRTFVLTDRKLHFRSIVDYATVQDFLMRWFGLHCLQMTTTAGGPAAVLRIPGVKDCLKVRDTLSEIDRMREQQ